jgi:predicted neutral ceramidase superfamily lipid hydrolase
MQSQVREERGGPQPLSEQPNGVRWTVQDHERRLARLEKHNEEHNFAVLENRIKTLEDRVSAMSRALWATAGSLVLAAVTFSLAVATGQVG